MHFSVFPCIQILNTFLPLNGGTLTPWRLSNILDSDSGGFSRQFPSFWKCISKGTLLQSVDDLLISSETKQDFGQNILRVLNFLV